jgi:hypothetical protein
VPPPALVLGGVPFELLLQAASPRLHTSTTAMHHLPRRDEHAETKPVLPLGKEDAGRTDFNSNAA